jgi:hypothetical protein
LAPWAAALLGILSPSNQLADLQLKQNDNSGEPVTVVTFDPN